MPRAFGNGFPSPLIPSDGGYKEDEGSEGRLRWGRSLILQTNREEWKKLSIH